MKTKETIERDLFNYFAGMDKLPKEYEAIDDVYDIIKEARQDWEDAEPEDADDVISIHAEKIYRILKVHNLL